MTAHLFVIYIYPSCICKMFAGNGFGADNSEDIWVRTACQDWEAEAVRK